MLVCPHCKQPIPLSCVALAACPLWIACPRCGVELVGDPFVKSQLAFMAAITAFFTIVTVRGLETWPQRIPALLVGGAVIVAVNLWITGRFGRYLLRQRC